MVLLLPSRRRRIMVPSLVQQLLVLKMALAMLHNFCRIGVRDSVRRSLLFLGTSFSYMVRRSFGCMNWRCMGLFLFLLGMPNLFTQSMSFIASSRQPSPVSIPDTREHVFWDSFSSTLWRSSKFVGEAASLESTHCSRRATCSHRAHNSWHLKENSSCRAQRQELFVNEVQEVLDRS